MVEIRLEQSRSEGHKGETFTKFRLRLGRESDDHRINQGNGWPEFNRGIAIGARTGRLVIAIGRGFVIERWPSDLEVRSMAHG